MRPRASKFLIASGTSEYADPSDALPSVRDDVDLITACFENMGYVPALKQLRRNPPLGRIRQIDKWFSARQPDDKVIFYYSGHGITDGDRHYLLLGRSDPEGPDRTALPCEELARLILKYSRAQQILLILDTCYSGRGTADIEALATRFDSVYNSNYQ